MSRVQLAGDTARIGAVSSATFATSVGEIDLAVVVLLFVAVSTTRASAVVFYDDDAPVTALSLFKNFIHMMALTVMAYAVILVIAAAGWHMGLGPVLLTGGTFGWTGPRINHIIAQKWISATHALIRPNGKDKTDGHPDS